MTSQTSTTQTSTMQIVIGAGPVGWTIAEKLAERGTPVRVLTRSGRGPNHPLVERLKVDATDAAAVTEAIGEATIVYHCMHGDQYSLASWQSELPAAEGVVLEAAGRNGGVVVFPESLYAYDTTIQPMRESSPRNATTGKRGVRTELLKLREESATHTVSVVASDFFGPRVLIAHGGERMVVPMLKGRTVSVLGSATTAHSFTYIGDLATAMITAGEDPRHWDRVLHAPTGPAITQRELAQAFAKAAGMPSAKVMVIPGWLLQLAGRVHVPTREMAEMAYQFTKPFVMDSLASEEQLGLRATPLSEAAATTVRWWRAKQAAPTAVPA